jgi:hypothetical protein
MKKAQQTIENVLNMNTYFYQEINLGYRFQHIHMKGLTN